MLRMGGEIVVQYEGQALTVATAGWQPLRSFAVLAYLGAGRMSQEKLAFANKLCGEPREPRYVREKAAAAIGYAVLDGHHGAPAVVSDMVNGAMSGSERLSLHGQVFLAQELGFSGGPALGPLATMVRGFLLRRLTPTRWQLSRLAYRRRMNARDGATPAAPAYPHKAESMCLAYELLLDRATQHVVRFNPSVVRIPWLYERVLFPLFALMARVAGGNADIPRPKCAMCGATNGRLTPCSRCKSLFCDSHGQHDAGTFVCRDCQPGTSVPTKTRGSSKGVKTGDHIRGNKG